MNWIEDIGGNLLNLDYVDSIFVDSKEGHAIMCYVHYPDGYDKIETIARFDDEESCTIAFRRLKTTLSDHHSIFRVPSP